MGRREADPSRDHGMTCAKCFPGDWVDPPANCDACDELEQQRDMYETLRQVRTALQRPDGGWSLNTLLQAVRNANALMGVRE